MKQIIGQIVSKNTDKVFIVKWDLREQTSWIEISGAEIMVGRYSKTAEEAIDSAQKLIDSQPDLY